MAHLVNYVYIVSAALFILSLKWMNSPVTARRGVLAGEIGMLLAIAGTLLAHQVVNWQWIIAAFLIGTAVGMPLAYIMPMTAVPQRTACPTPSARWPRRWWARREFYRESPHRAQVRDGGAGAGDAAGLSHLHGQPDGHRQAAGSAAAAAHHLPGPERHQLHAVCDGGGARRAAGSRPLRRLALPDLRRRWRWCSASC